MLSEHSLVSAAVAFGHGHFQLGVIVQSSHAASSDGINEFKTSIWPTVLEANELMIAHARIASKAAVIDQSICHFAQLIYRWTKLIYRLERN